MALRAMDDEGNAVDWWFIYKVAGEATTSDGARGPRIGGRPVTGMEYVYFDAHTPTRGKLTLSPHRVDHDGALPNTLKQLYASTDRNVGWFFYNDENPIDGKVNSGRGHTKGVLAFDLSSNTAFWLIQSTPRFPPRGEYSFPRTGARNAQTLLCISLQNADVAQSIARQMYVAQQPNVYLASEVPGDLARQPNDARLKLMQDHVASGSTPVHVVVPFRSQGGTKFTSIAKNRSWGLDFYNDLVGPTLSEDLDVETWEHDPVPPPQDSDKKHTVQDMKAVNLRPLGIDVAWPEADDHAKLAISAPSEQRHYLCVGDINYTIAQRKRGGGTVAFRCEALWASLSSILEGVAAFPRARHPPGGRTSLKKPAKPGANPRRANRRAAARTKTTRGKAEARQTAPRRPATRRK